MKLISENELRSLLIYKDIMEAILDNFGDEIVDFVANYEEDGEYILHQLHNYPDYKEKEFDNYNYD